MLKLATESTDIFQSQFYKQPNGYTTSGPLSVSFKSNIYLTKLKKNQVKPVKPVKFYRRFVDEVISRQRKNRHESLFDNLMETYFVHGESAQIFVMRKLKLEINFQVQDTQ